MRFLDCDALWTILELPLVQGEYNRFHLLEILLDMKL